MSDPLSQSSLSIEFQAILARLATTFRIGLDVKVTDEEWVQVSVKNLPAAQFYAELQAKRRMLFGASEPRVQVIQQPLPTGPVVYLHLLHAPSWGAPESAARGGKASGGLNTGFVASAAYGKKGGAPGGSGGGTTTGTGGTVGTGGRPPGKGRA